MRIAMVMVMDRQRVIGLGGKMPWHLSSELAYFKQLTMGKPLVMGRLTRESIGRALPGRTNIVVTRDSMYQADGTITTTSLAQAFRVASDHLDDSGEVMVIGGAEICRLAMPYTVRMYLTVIDASFEGDTWLESYVEDEWQEFSSVEREADGYNLSFKILDREPQHIQPLPTAEL